MFNGFEPAPFTTWTPYFAYAVPGDSTFAYSVQSGNCLKIGRLITVNFRISAVTTFSTASGALSIIGLPYASLNYNGQFFTGNTLWAGITKASYTNVTLRISAGATSIQFLASGSGVTSAAIQASDTPTGGTLNFIGSISYFV